MGRTKRKGAIAGWLMHELADCFRVLPILDRLPSGKYLRDWAAGRSLNPRTRKRVLTDLSRAALDGVGGPLSEDELVRITAQLLHRFCNWFDTVRTFSSDRSDVDLAVSWHVEHTLEFFGRLLGIARFAWGEPRPERPTLQSWSPRGSDTVPVPAALLDETIEKISDSARAQRLSMVALLDHHRDTAEEETATGGAAAHVTATKPATVKNWRRAKPLPNGERVDQLKRASAQELLRVAIGLRALVERVAAVFGDKKSAPLGFAHNRDATFIWLAHAEWTAFQTHCAFADNHVPPAAALRFFDRAAVADWLLPRLDVPGARRTDADLPYRLRSKSAVRVDFKFPDLKEPQSALIFVEQGQQMTVAFERVPSKSAAGAAAPTKGKPQKS